MNFPDKITFKIRDKKTKNPIDNLTVVLALYAREKNNYSVGPFITGENGEIIVTKEDCLKEIEDSKKMYAMDYESNLEECSDNITLETMTNEQIEYFIKDQKKHNTLYKKYNIRIYPEIFLANLKNSRNKEIGYHKFDFDLSKIEGKLLITIEI